MGKGLKILGNKNNKGKKATFAKASLVGATTVNGPGPERVSASPAASTKSTSWVAPEKKKLIQVDLLDVVGSCCCDYSRDE